MDCLESKTGLFQFLPLPTASGYPGGLAVGADFQVLPGAAASAGGAIAVGHAGAVTAVLDNATINHNGRGLVLLSSVAARTGLIVQVGTVPGQELFIINTNAVDTLTMDVVATSKVSNGASCVISAISAIHLTWDALNAVWVQTRAA